MTSTSDTALSDVAIIGMACRFADAPDYRQFRRNLSAGRESVGRPTRAALLAAGVPAALLDDPNYVYAGAPLEGLADFDAEFFGMSPREAEITDPQHRLFLECAWQALEDAGQIAAVAGQAVGVWGGTGTSLYLLQNLQHAQALMASVGGLGATLGNKADFLTLRVSHKLDLRGPSFNVQSGCSTGLVAVHSAVQSLLAGECRMALAGAACLTQLQPGGYLYQPGSIESPDGHCRAFDAQAAGTTRGSGAGVVVLKRLADALSDGDPIHAVIKATATNNDGADKMGMTAPSEMGQAAVIAEALALAGLGAEAIGCIEAHGTGTALGDPIEVAALQRAFGPQTQRGFCAIGSVKSNLGHLDAAAGIASLIKAVLMVSHREIYPTLHFSAPNPEIHFDTSPFYVARNLQTWHGETPRAGVSSFGMGGTNVHAIVQTPPSPPAALAHGPVLLVLSARSPEALQAMAQALAQALEEQPALALANVARTLQTGRRHWSVRRHVVAGTLAEAVSALRNGSAGLADHPLQAVGHQWCSGAEVDWLALPGARSTRHVHLPGYPFQRKRHWVDSPREQGGCTTPIWSQQPLPPAAPAQGSWWLLAQPTQTDDAEQVASRLRATGQTVQIGNADDLAHALSKGGPVGVLVWPGVAEPLSLLTQLAQANPAGPVRVWLLGQDTASVVGDETIDTAQTAGLAEARAWRHPHISVTTLDVPEGRAAPLPMARLAALGPAHLAWRGQRCFVQTLQPLPGVSNPSPRPSTGNHLIQPGLSPLGLQAARALVEAGARQITLVDELPPAAESAGPYLAALQARSGPLHDGEPDVAAQQALDRMSAASTCALLRQSGYALAPGEHHTVSELLAHVAPQAPYPRMLRAQLEDLATDGLIRLDGGQLEVLPAMSQVRPMQDWLSHIGSHHPAHRPVAELLEHCARQHAAVFAGRLPGTAVVASPQGAQRLAACSKVIDHDSSRGHCLRAVSTLVRDLAEASPQTLRILEVGGGRGGLTRAVLTRLGTTRVDYCFTDIGTAFVRAAQQEAERRGLQGFRTQRFDLDADPHTQGLEPASFDLVLGLDVVHATPDLARSLSHLRELLRPGGLVCLVERTQVKRWVEQVWGLETGWWLFQDAWRRHSPLTDLASWHAAMQTAGLSPWPLQAATASAHDTDWLLAQRPATATQRSLLDQLAQHQAQRRELFQSWQAECRQRGVETTLLPPAELGRQTGQAVALAVHVGTSSDDGPAAEAFAQALGKPRPPLLLVSGPNNLPLAAWHAAMAERQAGTVAWSQVSHIDAPRLNTVLQAGVAVIAGEALAKLAVGTPEPAGPTSDESAQAVVTQLWRDLLGVDQVAPDDDWYALGGDSLLTTRVITLLEQRYRVDLPVDQFFNATTINAMADALAQALAKAAPDAASAEAALLAEIEAMTDAELEAALQHTGSQP